MIMNVDIHINYIRRLINGYMFSNCLQKFSYKYLVMMYQCFLMNSLLKPHGPGDVSEGNSIITLSFSSMAKLPFRSCKGRSSSFSRSKGIVPDSYIAPNS